MIGLMFKKYLQGQDKTYLIRIIWVTKRQDDFVITNGQGVIGLCLAVDLNSGLVGEIRGKPHASSHSHNRNGIRCLIRSVVVTEGRHMWLVRVASLSLFNATKFTKCSCQQDDYDIKKCILRPTMKHTIELGHLYQNLERSSLNKIDFTTESPTRFI